MVVTSISVSTLQIQFKVKLRLYPISATNSSLDSKGTICNKAVTNENPAKILGIHYVTTLSLVFMQQTAIHLAGSLYMVLNELCLDILIWSKVYCVTNLAMKC